MRRVATATKWLARRARSLGKPQSVAVYIIVSFMAVIILYFAPLLGVSVRTHDAHIHTSSQSPLTSVRASKLW